MTTFQSITQCDKQFDDVLKNSNCKKGYSCTFFAILTAWHFLNGENATKQLHEKNIKNSVKTCQLLTIEAGLSFTDLLKQYTNININNIIGTCVDLVVNKIIGFEQMFPKNKDEYVVIFLKNERFIIVMVNNNKYHVRDCHENTQYDYNSLDSVINRLNNAYQFNKSINIDGYEFPEYSSIEFIILDELFETDMMSILGIDMFDLPSDVIISEKDMAYLEMLNDQFNNIKFVTINDINQNDFVGFE